MLFSTRAYTSNLLNISFTIMFIEYFMNIKPTICGTNNNQHKIIVNNSILIVFIVVY